MDKWTDKAIPIVPPYSVGGGLNIVKLNNLLAFFSRKILEQYLITLLIMHIIFHRIVPYPFSFPDPSGLSYDNNLSIHSLGFCLPESLGHIFNIA